MGCTYSTVEVDEVLWRCKERRRLMKQLMKCRADLAAALIAYLQSLRNTGATLRQLTEVGSMISGVAPPGGPTLQPSPPPPASLPPSPPPNFLRVATKESTKTKFYVEDPSDMDDDYDELLPPPPPPFPIRGWNFGEHMGSTPSSDSSSPMRSGGAGAPAPEDDWTEPKSEFGGEEEVVEEDEEDDLIQRKEALTVAMNRARETYPSKELADDNLSTVSKFTKDTDPTATASSSKKTWAGIAKELDEYFLKAAAGGKDATVFLEPNRSYLQPGDPEAKKGNLWYTDISFVLTDDVKFRIEESCSGFSISSHWSIRK
ncbi:uncharacterized protein LOC141812317 [Curcuma longa]|uniref:uncharacterized protein LOC141812317 n=1 Tax=Curcuma longa TaxID=136217 RepID=UPI003D9F6F0F